MSWRTNALVLQARNLGRRLGLNSKLSVLLNGKGYEARYDSSFQAELKAGHCVWDVGANVGYYTRQFAEKVGTTGKVFAFEPSPQNFNRLGVAVEDLAHVSLLNVGLGTEPGRLSFQQGADDLGAAVVAQCARHYFARARTSLVDEHHHRNVQVFRGRRCIPRSTSVATAANTDNRPFGDESIHHSDSSSERASAIVTQIKNDAGNAVGTNACKRGINFCQRSIIELCDTYVCHTSVGVDGKAPAVRVAEDALHAGRFHHAARHVERSFIAIGAADH